MIAIQRTDHQVLARRYPARTLNGSTTAAPWRAGDRYDERIVGWVMAVVATPAASSELKGSLRLRHPMKGAGVVQQVNDFGVARSGVVYIPYPFVRFDVRDANTGNAVNSSVTVSFWPVFRGDAPPAGVSSILYGRDRKLTPATPFKSSYTVPSGATTYRVMPAGSISALTVEEVGSGTGGPLVYAYYKVAATSATATTPGTETGAAAWRETPPGPGASIDVTGGAQNEAITVFWQYDLGALR